MKGIMWWEIERENANLIKVDPHVGEKEDEQKNPRNLQHNIAHVMKIEHIYEESHSLQSTN